MAVRENRRSGRLSKKQLVDYIPVGIAHTNHSKEYIVCSCGMKLKNSHYNNGKRSFYPTLKCPRCGIIVCMLLPRCRYCNAVCADIETRTIHEMFCDKTTERPAWHTAYNPGGYQMGRCDRCGKRFKHYYNERTCSNCLSILDNGGIECQ